jgi:hemolysin activation/secretion protein
MALAAPLMIVTVATAQVPGYNAGAAQQQATPPQVKKQQTTPQMPAIVQEEEKPLHLREGEKLLVKQIVLDGAKLEDQEELAKLVAPFEGKALTMSDILEAASKVTLYYRNKGYVVAKAYVPVQDASNGMLRMRVVLGHYGKFFLKNESRVSDGLLQRVFEKATRNEPEVRSDSLERAMLLVREMPGAKLPTVSIEPGNEPGTTNFVVKIDPSHLVSGYLIGDDQGSRYTGRLRLYGGANFNSLFHIADRFSVSAMTTEAQGVGNLRAAYSFPLSANGLRMELAASKTKYTLNGTYRTLNAVGLVDDMDATLSYPIARSRAGNFDFSMNFARKWLRDDILEEKELNRRSATVGSVNLQKLTYGQLLHRNAVNTVSISLNGGNLEPGAGTESGTPHGVYSRFNLGLFESMEATKKLVLTGTLKMQKACTNETLDSSEQMFLSGSSNVRSYTEGVSGDNGYVLNLDARYTLPNVTHAFKHTADIFADNGASYANKKGASLNDHIMISDVGGSYNANFKGFFASVQLAQSVGAMAYSSETSRTRFFFQAGMTF